ncbi:MAG: tetratricopeptide repeat protein, partial [Bryobacteraceae bacterium]
EKRQREAEEAARRKREESIAKGRAEAGALLKRNDAAGAAKLLERLTKQYPESIELRLDYGAAVKELERRQWEAEEQAKREAEVKRQQEAEEAARQKREESIAKGRAEAAALLSRNDGAGAVALLDRLTKQYPESIGLRRDLEAAVQALDRQRREPEERRRREAEDATRRKQEEAIANGRAEAGALLKRNDAGGAVKLLERLKNRYPNNGELRWDYDAAVKKLKPWKRESGDGERASPKTKAILAAVALAATISSIIAFHNGKSRTLVHVTPEQVTFATQVGTDPVSTELGLSVPNLETQATGNQSWIKAEAHGSRIRISALTQGLSPGNYRGIVSVRINSSAIENTELMVPVHLSLASIAVPKRVFRASPDVLNFTYEEGNAAPSKRLIVEGTTQFGVRTQVPNGGHWLAAQRDKGAVLVSVNPKGLIRGGTYLGYVLLDSEGSAEIRIPVNLSVRRAPDLGYVDTSPSSSRTMSWSGTLPPGETLTIQGDKCSPSGQVDPSLSRTGAVARIRSVTPPSVLRDLRIVSNPQQGNNFTLGIANSSQEVVESLTIELTTGTK